MITAFILDDQPINIVVLKTQLAKFFPNIRICGTGTDPEAALSRIRELRPDLLFLDIEMPGRNGFELLPELEDCSPEIIFVTAYSTYALKAFEHQAAGYITKPVDAEKLVQVVHKVMERITGGKMLSLLQQEHKLPEDKKLSLSTQKGFVFIDPATVCYCESSGNYTTFFLQDNKQILVSKQIGQFEQLLSPRHFVRIHDRYIINLKYVRAYLRGSGGTVILENDKELPVAVRRKEHLMKYFE
jgi:two-component system, LytTR family, response regulator